MSQQYGPAPQQPASSQQPAPPMPAQAPAAIGPKSLRVEIVLRGQALANRDSLAQMLHGHGWTLRWLPSGWEGVATKGSETMNVLFGPFAQYHEVRFSFGTLPDGHHALWLYRNVSGMWGGLWGMSKVKRAFRELSHMVEHHFTGMGAMVRSSGE